MMRHFLRDDDLSPVEQVEVLNRAAKLKAARHQDDSLAGPRTVALIFDKPTLRTQLSFAVAVSELGGAPMTVDGRLAQIGVRESVPDVARVLGRQVAAIVWRTFAQADLDAMAAYAEVPVVNALTDEFHPCQLLADLLTISERRGAWPVSGWRSSVIPPATWATPICSPARPQGCTSWSVDLSVTSRTRRSSPERKTSQ